MSDAFTIATKHWQRLDDGRLQCDVCPRACIDVPLHFTAFHPDYKMMDTPPTPPATLTRARRIGLGEGLRFVYTGNVHDAEGGSTLCPNCGSAVVVRDRYAMRHYALTDDGRCKICGWRVAGVYDGPAEQWGRRRLPIRQLSRV